MNADGRHVNSPKFDKVFTNKTLEHYNSHVVRSVAECTSVCESDRSKGCLLHNITDSITTEEPASSHGCFSLFVKQRGGEMTSATTPTSETISTTAEVVITDPSCRLSPVHPSYDPSRCPASATDGGI